MLKTVKVKKQMRLDEVVQYIFDNDIEDESYTTSEVEHFGQGKVRASVSGDITLSGYIKKDTTFIVEMEEEITEDTVFQDVVIIISNDISHMPPTKFYSIRSIRDNYPTVSEIHTLINGKLELIHERNV